MLVTSDHVIGAVLIYLLIGSLVWLAVYAAGIIGDVTRTRVHQGFPPSGLTLLISTLMVILAWPAFVQAYLSAGVRR